jgi:anti-sigma factor RsiW
LRARVRAALPGHARRRLPRPPRWLALAASVVFVVLGAGGLLRFWPGSSGQGRLMQEVVDSHIRSQLASHLLDVESSDGHTVKPWFQGKLDFSPAVIDLDDEGFVLTGGRMDYLDGRPVAALVYRRKKHLVNLLVWPAPPGEQEAEPRSETKQGFHLVRWCRGGMVHWAVSDLNPDEMGEFARLIRSRE